MKSSGTLVTWAAVCALTLALVGPATPAQAQQEDCRCIDASGAEIERCTCVRMPDVSRILAAVGLGMDRPRLGVSVNAEQTADEDARGARVLEVLDGGPADEAGIREGDFITRLDGRSLFEPIDADNEDDFDLDASLPVQRLLALARSLEPGEEVEVSFERDGTQQTATLAAEDLSDRWDRRFMVEPMRADALRREMEELRVNMEHLRQRAPVVESGRRFRLEVPDRDEAMMLRVREAPMLMAGGLMMRHGLEVVALNAGLGSYFGVEEGALVVDVDEGSELGLEPGDVIVRIGDRSVDGPRRLLRILATYAEGENVSFAVMRDGREVPVTGRLGGD